MASINLSGILTRPDGEPDVGAVVRFTHYTTTGNTVKYSYSELVIPPDGAYNIDLEYGQVRIDYDSDYKTERFISFVVVNQDSTATSIPELLNASVPPTDEQLLEFQSILADTVAAKDIAVAVSEQITTTELINGSNSFTTGDVIETSGFTSKGDGGGAKWQLTSTTGTPSQTPAQLGNALLNDADGRQWKLTPVEVLRLEMLGGFPSTGGDTYLYFLAAIADRKANGGHILASAGIWMTSGLIDVYDSNGTFLVGAGEDRTYIRRYGPYTGGLIRHGSTQDASAKARGGGLMYMTINGSSTSEYCLKSVSVDYAVYSNLRMVDPGPTGTAFWMSCYDDPVGVDPADSQQCDIKNIFTRNYVGGMGIYVDGNAGEAASAGANASLNNFSNIFCQIGGTANGFVFGFADGNNLDFLRVNQVTGGTGYGLVFKADDTGNKLHARQNICYNVQTAISGVLAEAGDGTEPSYQNAIYGFNTGNAGINNSPTVETGASLQWFDQTQAAFFNLNKGLSLATGAYLQSSADVEAIQKSDAPVAAHTLFSRSALHLDFISSTNGAGDKWRMGFVEGGDFTVSRPRSSGGSYVVNAPLELQGQTISSNRLKITINYVDYYIALTPVT